MIELEHPLWLLLALPLAWFLVHWAKKSYADLTPRRSKTI